MPTVIAREIGGTSGTGIHGTAPNDVNTTGANWSNTLGSLIRSGSRLLAASVSSGKCEGVLNTGHDVAASPMQLDGVFNMAGATGSSNAGVGFALYWISGTSFYAAVAMAYDDGTNVLKGLYILRFNSGAPGGLAISASTAHLFGTSADIDLRVVLSGGMMTFSCPSAGKSVTYTQSEYTSTTHGVMLRHANATADTVTFTINLASTTLTWPPAYFVYGCRDAQAADATLLGTITGGGNAEAELIRAGFRQVSPVDATRHRMPAVPRGQGTLTFRDRDNPGNSVTRAYVGMGMRRGLTGNSQCQGQGVSSQTLLLSLLFPDLRPGYLSLNYDVALVADPMGSSAGTNVDGVMVAAGYGGSVWPILSRKLLDSGVPVFFVPCGYPGSNLDHWATPTYRFNRATLHGCANFRFDYIGGVEAITVQVAETEMIASRTKAQIKTALAAHCLALADQNQAPICLIGAGQITDGAYGISTARWNEVLQAHEEVYAENPDTIWGYADLRSVPAPTSVDGLHWKSNAEIAAAAAPIGLAMYAVQDRVLNPATGGTTVIIVED